MSEPLDIDGYVAGFRAAIAGYSDDELLEKTRRQLSNSGWVQLKAYYLRELRNEIERRGLIESDAYRDLLSRVVFLDRP
jgi:hypothetical protein